MFIYSLFIHSFFRLFFSWFVHSWITTVFIHSFIYSLINEFIHLFSHLFVFERPQLTSPGVYCIPSIFPSIFLSLIPVFIDLSCYCSVTDSFLLHSWTIHYCFVLSFLHFNSFIHSSTQFIRSFVSSFCPSSIHSHVHWFVHGLVCSFIPDSLLWLKVQWSAFLVRKSEWNQLLSSNLFFKVWVSLQSCKTRRTGSSSPAGWSRRSSAWPPQGEAQGSLQSTESSFSICDLYWRRVSEAEGGPTGSGAAAENTAARWNWYGSVGVYRCVIIHRRHPRHAFRSLLKNAATIFNLGMSRSDQFRLIFSSQGHRLEAATKTGPDRALIVLGVH